MDVNKNLYIGDSPVDDPTKDEFNRSPFAKRVAQTLIDRSDPSSIVIGIYGPWGDGKSSVLNFIKKELEEYPEKIVIVEFNPWRFEDETKLLIGFFNTLAAALDKSLRKGKERVASWVKESLDFLTPFGTLLPINPADSAKKVAESISNVSLEELKKRLGEILQEDNKRIVVLMDDIDRLDKTEIQAVFKLVKLSADFANTAYIMAFDDEMVAAALQEKYASVKDSGRGFLEKIIQVPLNLPKIDHLSLRKFCFNGVKRALADADINLSKQDWEEFEKQFINGIEFKVHTPRMCRRYENALAFALHILKGEVNTVDLMLIEAIRIFHTILYDVIKNNIWLFVPQTNNGNYGQDGGKYDQKIYDEALSSAFSNLRSDERKRIKELLVSLFTYYLGANKELEMYFASNQKIASEHYFNRFFSYSVPTEEISELEIDSLLSKIKNNSTMENSVHEMKKLISKKGYDKFLSLLELRRILLHPNVCPNLAVAITKAGEIHPEPENFTSLSNSYTRIGQLIRQMVLNVADYQLGGIENCGFVKQIAEEAEPLTLAYTCLDQIFRQTNTQISWSVQFDGQGENNNSLDLFKGEYQREELYGIIIKRIKELVNEKPLFTLPTKPAKYLYEIWRRHDRRELIQYLKDRFANNPIEALTFVKFYVYGSHTLITLQDIAMEIELEIIDDAFRRIPEAALRKLDDPIDYMTPDEAILAQFFNLHDEYQKSKEPKPE